MGLKLTFYGGVGEVTGSRHLLETGDAKVLMDCGFFQGHRNESVSKNSNLPFDPKELSAVLLSHAHIDHSGSLPILAKKGFKSPIHCTEPTVELCAIMLMDSAHIQESDANFFNKIHQKNKQTIAPLFTAEDVNRCMRLFKTHKYKENFSPASGMGVQFLNAGHVLGSAMIQADVQTPKGRRRVLFTGDLGRRGTFLETPATIPENVDYLIIESTYGSRNHDPLESATGQLKDIITRAVKEQGKVLIPSFALERTQEIVFVLEKLRKEGAIPRVPIYVDSPTAVSLTDIYKKDVNSLEADAQLKAAVREETDPFGFKDIRYVRSPEESKTLNGMPGPMVIISASGMCEGGRILHHLRNNIDKENVTILIVGYQAEGTLGRRLVDGAKKVKIFGLEHEVWAKVEVIRSFSAHADQADLLWFIKSINPRPRQIFLVHGDPEDRNALADKLKLEGINQVEKPEFGNSFELE